MPVQDLETAAAKILAVEPTLKVNVLRASGALQRAAKNKVRTNNGPGSKSFTDFVNVVQVESYWGS